MKSPSRFTGALVFACSSLVAPFSFGQGALTPPGAPAPTMKSLDQIEARTIVNATNTPGDATNTFIISAPGSYYLTGNITGASGKHGISIQANDVTLDLNGFALISGGGGAFRGVNVPAAQTGFHILQGSVRGWTDGGVRADAAQTLAEKLMLTANTGGIGLAVGMGSSIRDCVASSNSIGFYCGDLTQVTACIATANSLAGLECAGHATILDCTSIQNGVIGLTVGSGSVITRCNVTLNVEGLVAGGGCTVADCTVGDNANGGITVEAGGLVRNCVVRGNAGLGIRALEHSYILGNTCDQNGTGISISGDGSCRVDGNSISANQTGLFLSELNHTHNLVVRNTFSGNALNVKQNTGVNTLGPMVDMTAGGTIAASTSPWANFIY